VSASHDDTTSPFWGVVVAGAAMTAETKSATIAREKRISEEVFDFWRLRRRGI